MRDLHPDLAASLATGCTTLCRCVRLICTDGSVHGFTDHDAPLTVDGTPFEPADGFEASQESAALGPATGEWDLKAALTSDHLSADDLLAGRYDGARVETLLVDWQNPDIFDIQSAGTLAEVTARDGLFQAEVRGPFAAFDRVRGRVFSARCDAELGDARCGVDLEQASYTAQAAVTAVHAPHLLEFADLDSFASGHFDGGTLRLGDAVALRVRTHTVEDGVATITLWHAPPKPFVVGDTLTLTAGCDKSFTTCRSIFNNGVNFRGFPHMPGDDFALSYPSSADGNLDGGSRSA